MKHLILNLFLIFSTINLANAETNNDPIEGVNRAMFSFNTMLDNNIWTPVAKGYQNYTPDLLQVGVHNFFANIKEIPTFVNQVLQLKLTNAMDTRMRFIFNSTLGLAGLVDVATEMGFKKGNEDFGQTLGFYGVGNGPYLILPIIGPSSLRDITIFPVDGYAASQVNSYLTDNQTIAKNLIFGIDARASAFPQTDVIYSANDPYTTLRSSYLQHRDFLINNGELSVDDIDF